MQFILGFVAILGGAAFWWWRLKMLGEATNEIGDAAGRAIGKYKRYKFRKKMEDSPLESVDDPAAAAVVLMYAIAQEKGPLTPETEAAIRKEIISTMGLSDPTELMVFSKWAAAHVTDPNNVSLRYAKLWCAKLNEAERRDLFAMAERLARSFGASTSRDANFTRLRERLGLAA